MHVIDLKLIKDEHDHVKQMLDASKIRLIALLRYG